MTKPAVDFDKDISSQKKIKEIGSLNDTSLKNLLKATKDFIDDNETACSKTPRMWKKENWQGLAGKFIHSIGKEFFSKERDSFDANKDLAWPDDEEALKFIAFSLLKIECAKHFSSKRKNEGSAGGTPNKKQATGKSSTPSAKDKPTESEEGSEDDDGSNASEEEDGSSNEEEHTGEKIQGKKIPKKDPFGQVRQGNKNTTQNATQGSKGDERVNSASKLKDPGVFNMGEDLQKPDSVAKQGVPVRLFSRLSLLLSD